MTFVSKFQNFLPSLQFSFQLFFILKNVSFKLIRHGYDNNNNDINNNFSLIGNKKI